MNAKQKIVQGRGSSNINLGMVSCRVNPDENFSNSLALSAAISFRKFMPQRGVFLVTENLV